MGEGELDGLGEGELDGLAERDGDGMAERDGDGSAGTVDDADGTGGGTTTTADRLTVGDGLAEAELGARVGIVVIAVAGLLAVARALAWTAAARAGW